MKILSICKFTPEDGCICWSDILRFFKIFGLALPFVNNQSTNDKMSDQKNGNIFNGSIEMGKLLLLKLYNLLQCMFLVKFNVCKFIPHEIEMLLVSLHNTSHCIWGALRHSKHLNDRTCHEQMYDCIYIYNSLAYGTRRFNAEFTRAL